MYEQKTLQTPTNKLFEYIIFFCNKKYCKNVLLNTKKNNKQRSLEGLYLYIVVFIYKLIIYLFIFHILGSPPFLEKFLKQVNNGRACSSKISNTAKFFEVAQIHLKPFGCNEIITEIASDFESCGGNIYRVLALLHRTKRIQILQ